MPVLTTQEIKWLGSELALYDPLNGDQMDFFTSLANIKWLFGGNRSGKTYNNMVDLALLALGVHPFRNTLNEVHWVCIES